MLAIQVEVALTVCLVDWKMVSYIKERWDAVISVIVGEERQRGRGWLEGGGESWGRETEKGIWRFRIIEILERIYYMRPTYTSVQHVPQEDSEDLPIAKVSKNALTKETPASL